VSLASGVGPKQASLFLRNVGFANDLAVLDVHVLRYMDKMDLAPAITQIVHTLEGYERIELAFCKHARDLGFPPLCFDLAVWIVMRVL
jgi:N-glycosylase/DNA lyase